MKKTYTLKLTEEQIKVINGALNADYHKLQKAVEESTDENLKDYWNREFRKTADTLDVIFSQYYNR